MKKLLKTIHCPKCGEKQPKIRTPKNIRQILWGGNTCKECGCEMDRFGRRIN